ncbi:MAG TPA: carboxypeptidase-like regulatory domain-containing protein, partial [Chryseolinea sp.]|nr:carboxypeptidase-like regulatory domain-containing protein [Chryseolinea sp.]
VRLLPRGRVHLIVLYNDDRYLKMENIVFRTRQQIWIDFRGATRRPSDSSTSSWRQQAAGNCFPQSIPRITSLRQPRKLRGGYGGNVSGTVYDDEGMPLPGVNIVIKGTTLGTVTDIAGNFSLELLTGYEALVASFIGYKTAEVAVRAGSIVAVQMQVDVTALQEVVVTGYGMEQRSYLASSATSLLMGRVAGVQFESVSEATLAEDYSRQEQREAEQHLYEELLTLNGMRSNFTDVAFWEPKLYTNRKGTATFAITFPDDITRWNAVVYAMNRRLQTGMIRQSIRSYKPIMAQLDVPRFLVHGDSAFVHGNLSNYTTGTTVEGSIKWRAPGVSIDSFVRFDQHLYNSLPLTAPGMDSVSASYEFNRSDGYRDGELRSIPVIEQGTLRADGQLSIFANGNRHISADAGEQVTVELLGSTLDIFTTEATHLIDYRYACNEQLASKLLGLIAYKNAMQYEEKVFHYDDDVKTIIRRLLKNQNSEFLWSWWDVSPNTSYWISAHILRALKVAQDAGYEVDLNIKNIASKATYKFDMLESFSYHDADLLQALAEWKVPLKYRAYVTGLDSLLLQRERYLSAVNHYPGSVLLRERLLLMEIRQLSGIPFHRDSLLRYRQEGIRGEVYFSAHKEPFDWYRDELAANAVAYRIARRDTALQHLLLPMQLYFVSRRSNGQWNTYQGANLLLSVMPDLLSMGASRKHPYSILADGKFNGTIEKLPFKITLQPHEQLNLSKERGLPAYLMQYTTRRVTQAAEGGDGFRIATALGNGSQVLKAGKVVKMVVDVTVKKNAQAEYVMIEVPVPAACSYTEDRQKTYPSETHREYYKDRINIYFEHMGAGEYRFEVELLPRFTGRFHVNPAQVSLMYVPVINANTALHSVHVVN